MAKAKRENGEYIQKFYTADEIDKIIKNRIKLCSPKNRKTGMNNYTVKWQDYEIECRRQVILDLIRQGLSKKRITEEIMVRWNIAIKTAERYIKDALDYLTENREDFIEHNREIQTERIQGVLEDCLQDKDYKNALKALDQLNKIGGIYTENRNIDIAGDITFDFAGE